MVSCCLYRLKEGKITQAEADSELKKIEEGKFRFCGREYEQYEDFSIQVTCKLRIACTYQGPKEQLESRSVRLEMLSTLIGIDIVNMNHAQGEWYVNNHENEQEHQHVQDHVGHTDNDGTSLPPHQSNLNRSEEHRAAKIIFIY